MQTADGLIEGLQGAMAVLTVGDPHLFTTDIGPVIDADAKAITVGRKRKSLECGLRLRDELPMRAIIGVEHRAVSECKDGALTRDDDLIDATTSKLRVPAMPAIVGRIDSVAAAGPAMVVIDECECEVLGATGNLCNPSLPRKARKHACKNNDPSPTIHCSDSFAPHISTPWSHAIMDTYHVGAFSRSASRPKSPLRTSWA